MRIRSIALPLGLSLLAMALAGAGSAQEIGAAGAVNPASSGTPPGRATRVLELGARVIHRERIQTTASGSVQLIFIDKTTLNVGPNSDLIIDEFIYDPNRGAGQMAISMTKGVLRFVGGNISHSGGATVKTPAATLGIRGGVATIKHQPCGVPPIPGQGALLPDAACGTRAINHFGVMTVSTGAGTEIIRRPGFAVTIVPGASTLPAPQRVSQAEVDATNRQLSSKAGQKGGAPNRPTEQAAARAGVGIQNAGVTPSLISVQSQTAATSATQTTVLARLQQGVQNLQQTAGNSATQAATDAAVIQDTRNQPKPPTGLSQKVFALTTTPDPALNSPIPYVLGAAVASGGVTVTPIMVYRPENTDPGATGPATGRTLQVAFGVNGAGASQTSNIMVSTGIIATNAAGDDFFNAGFVHTARRAANITPARANGAVTSLPNSFAVDADRVPTNFTVNQNDTTGAAGNDRVSVAAFERPGGNGPSQTYSFQQPVVGTTTPSGLGQNRPAASLVGFAAGMVQTLDVTNNVNIEAPQPLLGGAGLQLDPGDSRVQLNLFMTTVRSGPTPAGGLDTAAIQIGNVDPTQRARGTYIDYDNFGGREAAINVSPTSQTPVSTANGQPLTNDHSLMVSAAPTNVATYFPGVNFCQCEYTRWGFWSQENQRTANGLTYSDRIHLGTWVAGQPAASVDVPTVGIATYNGHVIASIASNGDQYVAAGNLTNTLNFGAGTGTSTVTNLDGRNYAGPLTLAPGSPAFGGLLAATNPAYGMTMAGQLMKGGSSPVGEMGGLVLLQGPGGYGGSGIFAARR